MRTRSWFPFAVVLALPSGCAQPCQDDGLIQSNDGTCPTPGQASASATDTDTAGTAGTATMGESMSDSMGSGSQSGSDTGGTLDGTESDSDTDGSGDTTMGERMEWCVDADGDGFGDPDMCQSSSEPVDGSVPNGDDCADDNPDAFPGAAPNDDPEACMQDADGDDWGDDDPPKGIEPGTDCDDGADDIFPGAAENEMPPDLCMKDSDGDGFGDDDPPPGVEPGTDCLDDDPFTFPGAAENETPPDLCMTDADDDGWGDANPGNGLPPGSDCYDGNVELNPDTLQLTAMLPHNGGGMQPRTVVTVDPATAATAPFLDLVDAMGGVPDVDLSTATLQETGVVYVNDINEVQLNTLDYGATCMMGTGEVVPVGAPYGMPGDVTCGLEFGSDGMLYGIDRDDSLLVFDTATGQIVSSTPITFMGIPLNISACGMAFDCREDRLLVANGVNQTIYSIEPGTGVATEVRNLDAFFGPAWDPAGLAYEPVTQTAYVSTGNALFSVDLDTMDPPQFVGAFPSTVSNLQYMPGCI